MQHLEVLQASFPDLSGEISQIYELYNKSLWHELTLKLTDFTKIPQLHLNESTLPQLFTKVILPIHTKLNPLSVAKLGVWCSKPIKDTEESRKFLSSCGDTVKPKSEEAFILCRCEEASLILRLSNIKESKKILEECTTFIRRHEAQDVDPSVLSTYHCCYASYLKASGQYDDFYKEALLFLVYSDIESMPIDQQQKWAYDIGLAALLGEKIYNFGELLANPVLKSLESTNLQWIGELLRAFNRGDMMAYQTVTTTHGAKMGQVPELKDKAPFLQNKIKLMALLNYLFGLSVDHTIVPFKDVSEKTNTPVGEVEFILLKALSIGIIKGIIDQVAQTISVSWVQARVLDREEIKSLASKVATWSDSVRSLLDTVSITSSALAQE